MKRLLVFATVVALSLVTSGLLLAQSNPNVGTWKLNPAKSKSSPAGLIPKGGTRTVTAQGDGAKYSYEGVAGDGSQTAYSFTTNYDGEYSAISGVGFPGGADTYAVKRVDANTFMGTGKKAGKVVGTNRTVVSKDEKVATITGKGTDAQGKPTITTTVWDKQ
jgi:hypothetical protein